MTNEIPSWWLFTGVGEPNPPQTFPAAPPWRVFASDLQAEEWRPEIRDDDPYWKRARTYCVDPSVVGAINAALWLRRPLLVTGSPGAGKTSLIYRVAWELGLGPVLEWPVSSRTRVEDALYRYDALARLQAHERDPKAKGDLGEYITLMALGTALLPASRPRALLIDEIDKADPDLPNDLLNIFEEGSFKIPELVRENASTARLRPMVPVAATHDAQKETVVVTGGTVRCREFPFVVLTSNGERDFPPAFLRRCIRIKLPDPDFNQLSRIVTAHLGADIADRAKGKITSFASEGVRTTAMDQFLNTLHLIHKAPVLDEKSRAEMEALLTQPIQRS